MSNNPPRRRHRPPPVPQDTGYPPGRLLPLDTLRGLIMVLMALDHANHLVAHGKLAPELWSGPFPDYRGDGLAFLIRFVTHLAAPGFFFLMGTGMVLFAASRRRAGWSQGRIARHFVIRGALLILFQFLLENPVWRIGQAPDPTVYVGVLYALGGAMIVGVLFLRLPGRGLLALSALLIVATELLLPTPGRESAQVTPLLRLWLLPGYTPGLYVLYPLMPWLGVTGLGMAYGRWLRDDRAQAYRGASWLGLAALLLFLPIRWLGAFGNIRPPQGDDWIAFLNLVKYPPSLSFLLLTLGGNLLLLGFLAQVSWRTQVPWRAQAPRGAQAPWRTQVGLQPLAVFGQAPLFFYLTHLYLYGYLGQWIAPDGMRIRRMLPYWLLGLAILYPLCWLYARFKHSRPPGSPWRFL